MSNKTPNVVVIRHLDGIDPDVDMRVELVLYFRDRIGEEYNDPRFLVRFYGKHSKRNAKGWCKEHKRKIVGKPEIVK